MKKMKKNSSIYWIILLCVILMIYLKVNPGTDTKIKEIDTRYDYVEPSE